jgi:hypothetical protein
VWAADSDLKQCLPAFSGHSIFSLQKDDLPVVTVLPCGRIMFANKLQKSSKNLQKVQPRRANSTWTGTVKVSLRLGSSKAVCERVAERQPVAKVPVVTVTSGCPVTRTWPASTSDSCAHSDCASSSGWARRRRPCLRVSRALSGCSVHSHGRDDLRIGT